MNLADLNLAPGPVLDAATAFVAQFGDGHFTSGRRDWYGEAHAVAVNVALKPNFIASTYVASPVSIAAQASVAGLKDVDQITQALLDCFGDFTDAELAHFSSHPAGEAFDVDPLVGAGAVSWLSDYAKQSGHRFLTHECELSRLHYQL